MFCHAGPSPLAFQQQHVKFPRIVKYRFTDPNLQEWIAALTEATSTMENCDVTHA